MIPRFSNPHFLPQTTEPATRAQLYTAADPEHEDPEDSNDAGQIALLTQILSENLPSLDYGCSSRRRKKDDLVERSEEQHDQEERQVLIRLLSSTQPPHLVSLHPPPPPPSITREPDVEDSEEQALRRRQRAEASAVDVESILAKASSLATQSDHTALHFTSQGFQPSSPLMIVQTVQDVRKTRPPVPSSMLLHHPYASCMSSVPPEPPKSRRMDCPVIDVSKVVSQTTRQRRKRKNGNAPAKIERPLPSFWKPNPALQGKCLGYAYGYPSSLFLEDVSGSHKYRRDTMKKAVFNVGRM
ncbi:hypothetical protein CPC08DRAFT_815488 [Agrocybe pediades]|nr:hypothetical protein CPC08DRAFT_815488 [Agrocybe pediades]